MPIENYKLKERLQLKIEKHITALVEDDIIEGIEPGKKNYHIIFCFALQFVPKYSKQRFSFGKPEGVRVFITTHRKITIAIDYVFHKQSVKFSHIYQGPKLMELVKGIKRLQHAYSKSKGKLKMELIQFLFLRAQFVLVKVGRDRSFYRIARGKLTGITLQELKHEIEPILKSPPIFENH